MACFLPFRPWLSPDLRVFRSEPRGTSRRIPRMSSPALTRHPSGSLQRASFHSGDQADPVPQAKLLACIRSPTAYPDRGTLFRAWLETKRSNGLAVPSESPAFRVWLPSWRRQLLDPRKPVSVSHAHGLHSSGRCSDPAAEPRFPKVCPLLRFPLKPNGLKPALQRLLLATSAAPTGSPTLFG
jgi:hypothetical protein